VALAPGTRLGAYEILTLIGSGGMGEVYRARDARLARDVAIKVLPSDVAADADRLARFEREAQVLASLNHPNIAHIHGVDESAGVPALIMELVEGPTLADRIAKGPIPLDEALPIAKQIAEALEAAHEQGIIHRDLKPANIKVRPDGTVKVLDFGLAKAMETSGGAGRAGGTGGVSMSPTLSIHATQAGVILGTAAFMSPEQARGRAVDRRADIWAFGCVLYEMLTAAVAFSGDDVTDTIVAVVSKEPDWTTLPVAAQGLRPLVESCLRKDPKRRLQSIGDVRVQIEDLLSGPIAAVQPTPSRAAVAPKRPLASIAAAATIAGAAVAALATWAVMRPAPRQPEPTTRFTIVPPVSQPLAIRGADRDLAISPDGRLLAYRAGPSGAVPAQLMIRALDQLESRPVPGASDARGPFFSPDSKWIAFFSGAELKKVAVNGGPAMTLCHIPGVPRGGTWLADNTIVFATISGAGLQRVPAGGGDPAALTTLDQKEAQHLFPDGLPDGRGVLFTITGGENLVDTAQIAVLDLKTGKRKVLVRGGSDPAYTGGQLVYAAAGSLRAVPFDLGRLETTGDPVPLVEHVLTSAPGGADYTVSQSGTLVYVQAGVDDEDVGGRSLVWVDRQGHEEALDAQVRRYSTVRLSPDGTRIAAGIRGGIWVWDLKRQTLTRVTFGPALDQQPLWTTDSRRIIFSSSREGVFNLYAQSADGTGSAERLTTSGNSEFATGTSPDGAQIIGEEASPTTSFNVMMWPLASPRGAGRPLVSTAFTELNAVVSGDGRYIAYQANDSGPNEIYVRPFPNVDAAKWQVSTTGGTRPAWSADGRELFYVGGGNGPTLFAVPVATTGTAFVAGNPVRLFGGPYTLGGNSTSYRSWDVARDGRFLMIKVSASTDAIVPVQRDMVVVLNPFDELRANANR
jgi:serine/threonine-protein kinase